MTEALLGTLLLITGIVGGAALIEWRRRKARLKVDPTLSAGATVHWRKDDSK